MLEIDTVTLRAGDRVLLDRASASLPARARAGLVGPNGSGKTTLLRAIAGELASDGGGVRVPATWRIARLGQEAPGGEQSLIQAVLAADLELAELQDRAERETDTQALADIHERLATKGAHAAEAKAARILAGLGFSDADQGQPCSAFSGGWRMRVALAGLLFAEPDLLLLDEPTNHLDLESTLWLESYLGHYPGTVLLVSHDRRLLNRVCTQILHLNQAGLAAYTGNYDAFVTAFRERQRHAEAQARHQEAERQRIQAFINRFRANASKARQAQSRIKMLERMEEITQPVSDKTYPVSFPEPSVPPPPLLTLDRVRAGYGQRRILNDVSLRIDPEDRIALLGPNGAGKSTLAKLLAGHMAPWQGTRVFAKGLRIGYFAQHQADLLSLQQTPLQHMAELWPSAKPATQRAFLGRFGLVQARAETPVAELSGGETARLLFALMAADYPNLLILDEPTNHLDIDGRDHLVSALNAFPGAVVLISHDPHLIALTADRLWHVGGGTVADFPGDLSDYERQVLSRGDGRGAGDQRGDAGAPAVGGRSGSSGGASREADRKARADKRARQKSLRQEVARREAEVTRLSQEKDRLEGVLADPNFYNNDSETISRTQKALAETQEALTAAEESWLAAAEALEAGAETSPS